MNTFWLILCLTLALGNLISIDINHQHSKKLTNKLIEYKHQINEEKSILLIILDEYSSPAELMKFSSSQTLFSLSKKLKSQGWFLKEKFRSEETSTIHSLTSLFNFNLSQNSNYSTIINYKLAEKFLLNSPSLIDSLENKKIKLNNYGIFHLGKSKPMTRLYFYPTSFAELLFYYSVFPILWTNTGGLKPSGFDPSYQISEEHNKSLISKIKRMPNHMDQHLTFTYAHLYMPHYPYTFKPTINHKIENVENYVNYWKFTNQILFNLLDDTSLKSNFRIIVTGDHGFRGNNMINPNLTFAAFWGFEKEDVDKIMTVQDLGSLINAYF